MDDVGLHHQVLVNELGQIGVVGMNAAYFGGGQIHLVWLFGFKKCLNSGLVGEVELRMGAGDDAGLALLLQGANDGCADHAAMAGDIYFGLWGHVGFCVCVFVPFSATSCCNASISALSSAYSSNLRARNCPV